MLWCISIFVCHSCEDSYSDGVGTIIVDHSVFARDSTWHDCFQHED
jgi:hypothetical protein